MSNEQPVENLMRSTMENLRDMIDANTVIGEPIETKDGTCIIPVSRLSFGFVSGGSEFMSPRNNPEENSYPFGGGAGSGVSVKPITFLVIKDDMVRMMPIEHDNTYDRIADNIPQVLDMIKNLIKDISSNKNKKSDCYDSIKKDDLSDTCSNND
ncbi:MULTISPECIES: GerW family sporulation protein [Clostridium]|jgi:sporulation protein YtfJ|uniref:Sporulation protein YtfJ n=2 Tax=Clostridium butyricum TaxID=1492 RepID=A0A427STY1_CLOBU|nr:MULTISPECIES: GerW family sporulation protein [Clostridium]ETI90658.1 MAG: Sporulation protein YtfJ [Clostridium butyricum DORA_1]ALP90207.1 sporulation protein YtfJ [Clostridium butyricum]ALS16661.1 sporulation protein YtfJ [Clostridium butyricum]ANF13825.1 sporulation protein YtfJ [Clostridium butyricum]AOR93892.1 sporulation protein YtfJ [Clostridium butyricum]